RIDGDDLGGRPIVEIRIRLPRLAEERGLRDDVLVAVEHDDLRARLVGLEVPGDLAGALVGPGRAAKGDGRAGGHEDGAAGYGRDLPRQLRGLGARLPRVEHRALVLGEPLDLIPLEVHARGHDEPVVLEVAVADADAFGFRLDGGGAVANDLDAAAREPIVL